MFTSRRLNQAKAGYESSLAAKAHGGGQPGKSRGGLQAQPGIVQYASCFRNRTSSGSRSRATWPRRNVESADDQVDVAKAAVDSAQDSLDKTTIVSPLDGTITTLNSQLGERVLGTVQNAGTDIMTISDLSEMEARVDVGEMDVVLMQAGPKGSWKWIRSRTENLPAWSPPWPIRRKD